MFIKLVLAILSIVCLLHYRACCSGEKLQPLPPTPDYKAAGVKYEHGGLGPLFNFARSFINTALPGGLPVEFMKKTIDDPGSLISNPMQLLQMFKGYVAAIAVGLLFVIIVPLVGMCFCCCRLCGNCGGNRHQKMSDSIHCKRRVFAGIVFVTTVFTLVGNICTYVSNDRMTTALGKVGDIVDRNLDDIDTFLDYTVNQTQILGVENFKITKEAILDKINMTKMKDDISAFVVNEIADGALDKMQEHMKDTVAAFNNVKQRIADVASAASKCTTGCPLSLPNTSSILPTQADKDFEKFKGEDPVIQVKQEIGKNVGSKLTDLDTVRSDVEHAFNEMEIKVKDYVDKIKEFKTKAANGIDIPAYKRDVKSYTDTAKQYDKYRHMGGVILSAVITLVVSLQMFGLVFGSLGQGLKTAPTERGCVSNSGGNFLIASVAFIFLFSWLLMLLTTLSFAVGSLLERFVCQPLAPPDFQFLTIAESKFDTKSTLNASISDILRDCRDGKSAYSAFHLQSKFNIDDVDQLLNDKLKTIQNKTQGQLNSIGSLDTGASATQATASLNNLTNILKSIQFDFSSLRTQMNTLPDIPPEILDYKKAMIELESALAQLKSISGQVDGWKTSFNNSLELVKTNLPTQLATILQKFNNELSSVAQVYVKSTKNSILNEVGQCTPLWNLYDSIIVVSFCNYIVDAFNGFWFSIGWCLFFFMPSIIFSVKLAKHYRTMEEDDDEKTSGQAVSNMAYESNNQLIRSNKVGHKDEPEPENKV